MSKKRLSPAAVIALKNALTDIYWYKNDLRNFITDCIQNKEIANSVNWDNYKRQIVSDLVNILTKTPDCLNDLTTLCSEVTLIDDFSHLERLEDGQQKASKARTSVSQLQRLMKSHQSTAEDRDSIAVRQRKGKEKEKEHKAFQEKLADINSIFQRIARDPNRGFELEKLMRELFDLYDLDPKASFRIEGEQVDGGFSLDGTDYLFEAKWQREPVGASALDIFGRKIERKLENTLGVFLSINGFSPNGVQTHTKTRPSTILMDGQDLMAVLDERIDLVQLLNRKKRHAARTGEIYLRLPSVTDAKPES